MLTIKNLNKTKAICICECGNTREVSIYNLNKIFPSCRKCYFKSKFDPNKIWKLEYSEYIKSAKKRNLDFNLTLEQFINFIQLNCYYCNAVPNGTTHSKYLKRNGIDRLDNNKHYEFSNCVPCCAMCNAAKSNKTLPDFLNWINRIHSNFYKNIESKF